MDRPTGALSAIGRPGVASPDGGRKDSLRPRRRRRLSLLLLSTGGVLVGAAVALVLVISFTATPDPNLAAAGASGSAGSAAAGGPASAAVSVSPSAAASASHRATASPGPAKPSAPPTAGTGLGNGPTLPGWPSADNTGVPKGVALKSSSDITVTKAGTVVDGLDVHGQISVEADNVVIKRTRVTNSTSTDWGIVQRDTASGLIIEDSQIRGNGSQEMQQGVLNLGGDLTVLRTDISQISDGIATVRGLIQDNFLHDPKAFNGDHVDLIQATSGPPAGKSLTIRHNTAINTQSQTSAIALFQDFGIPHDTTIENNFLGGGGYTVYGGDGDKGTPTNIRIQNNTFSRQVYPKGGYFGPIAYWSADGSGNVWSDNVWADTGAAFDP